MGHMSHVICNMSLVMFHISKKKKNVELVGGGSVINIAHPIYFLAIFLTYLRKLKVVFGV